jgi:hypothetical protein
LSAKLVPTFADRGCRVVSATDPQGRIFGFLDTVHIFTNYLPNAPIDDNAHSYIHPLPIYLIPIRFATKMLYDEFFILEFNCVQPVENDPSFRRNISPPSTGSMISQTRNQHETGSK